jgi:hypothetical protein
LRTQKTARDVRKFRETRLQVPKHPCDFPLRDDRRTE